MDPESIRDLFQELGPVRIRRMFGGQGIYSGELMFALELGGELYLKTDEGNRAAFEAAGSRPFIYAARGRTSEMSYWLMPAEALDDPSKAARWGRSAMEAARRAAAAKPPRKRRA